MKSKRGNFIKNSPNQQIKTKEVKSKRANFIKNSPNQQIKKKRGEIKACKFYKKQSESIYQNSKQKWNNHVERRNQDPQIE